MDYAQAKAEGIGYSRQYGRNIFLQRKDENDTYVVRYYPRSDVRKKAGYIPYQDLVTYYADGSVKVDIGPLPRSANLLRILNEWLPDNIGARISRGQWVFVTGYRTNWTRSDDTSWSFRSRPGYPFFDLVDEIQVDTESEQYKAQRMAETAKAQAAEEAAAIRKEIESQPPDNIPDGTFWNNGNPKPPYPISDIPWSLRASFAGFQRIAADYLTKSNWDKIISAFPNHLISIHKTNQKTDNTYIIARHVRKV